MLYRALATWLTTCHLILTSYNCSVISHSLWWPKCTNTHMSSSPNTLTLHTTTCTTLSPVHKPGLSGSMPYIGNSHSSKLVSNFLLIISAIFWRRALHGKNGMDGTFIKKLNIDTFSLNNNHKLESWVEPAFHGLMKLQMEDVSPEDPEHVPRKIWNAYISVKSEITQHWLALAFEALPQFNHTLSTTNLECGYW